MVIVIDIRARLRQLMDSRGWTSYRLAKESGLSESTVSNIFNRNYSPSVPTLEAICRGLNISLQQFFTEDVTTGQITEEQAALIERWNMLTSQEKQIVLDLIDSLRRNRS